MSAASSVPTAGQLADFQQAGIKHAVVEGAQNGSPVPDQILQAFESYSNNGFTFGTGAYCFLYLYSGNLTGRAVRKWPLVYRASKTN